MSLKNLEHAIELKVQKNEAEEKNRHREILKRKKEKRLARAEEERRAKEKNKHATEIFGWAKGFVATPAYQKLLRIAAEYPYLEKTVFIYSDGWGHEVPHKNERGCWSNISLSPNATFSYEAGYKWMGVSFSFKAETPADLADRLNHTFLEEFLQAIKSEKIYHAIKDRYAREQK
ncbi:MAG: hypothetical protein HY438_03270 [DPANN group archaeon]|nr:hypothetical protein [DPANN group archaeon]